MATSLRYVASWDQGHRSWIWPTAGLRPGEDDLERTRVAGAGEHVVGILELVEQKVG